MARAHGHGGHRREQHCPLGWQPGAQEEAHVDAAVRGRIERPAEAPAPAGLRARADERPVRRALRRQRLGAAVRGVDRRVQLESVPERPRGQMRAHAHLAQRLAPRRAADSRDGSPRRSRIPPRAGARSPSRRNCASGPASAPVLPPETSPPASASAASTRSFVAIAAPPLDHFPPEYHNAVQLST